VKRSHPTSSANAWFVYIARCADGTLYTGTAVDVRVRIDAHNSGRGARYTRGRVPIVLCAQLRCASRGDALRLEFAIKRLSREAKLGLLERRRLSGFARRVFATRSRPPEGVPLNPQPSSGR
jgi:predicted GIY-YIG superfamily endonuclease